MGIAGYGADEARRCDPPNEAPLIVGDVQVPGSIKSDAGRLFERCRGSRPSISSASLYRSVSRHGGNASAQIDFTDPVVPGVGGV